MKKNVIIGIGGTGARVIESVIHLCAAGLGPDKLSIIMVDPDEANGNLTHTKSLIKQYVALRNSFQRVKNNPCFKTEIVIPANENTMVWNIFNEKDSTLAKYINYDNLKQSDPNLSDFAEVLFTEKELKTALNEGFRGHPSIGAVVMADPPMNDYPFKILWEDIENTQANDLRVFLVGSIFGGTGAAGFPTLGSKQLIKFNNELHAKLSDEKSRVLLGGALVLPYFSFSTDGEIDEPMFVTTTDFPIATKAALQYYNDKELGFDQYYFIGDSVPQKVGSFSTGSSTQENFPHYIEIVSALASFDFFEQPRIENVPDKKYFIACRETEKLNWDMIPITRNGERAINDRDVFKKRISDFSIFGYTFLTYGQSALNKSHKDVLLQPWYSDNFKSEFEEGSEQYNPRIGKNSDLYKLTDEYLKNYLFWISAICNNQNVELIDRSKIIDGDLTIKERTNFSIYNPELYGEFIGQIIQGRTNGLNFNAFLNRGLKTTVLKEMDEIKIETKAMSAGNKFLNIFYLASRKFNEENLKIN